MNMKPKKTLNIPGTSLSSHNSNLIVSTGIASLDELLGGGVPAGTVLLIEEDVNGAYAKTILKYFLAEGVVNKHAAFVCSKDVAPNNIVTSLPSVLPSDPEPDLLSNSDKMKIAFRYENMPTGDGKTAHKFGHYYDLASTMPSSEMKGCDIDCWVGDDFKEAETTTFSNPVYHDLLKSIRKKIKDGGFKKTDAQNANVLRIVLHSLGSPMWLPNRQTLLTLSKSEDLDMFIYCLRAVVSDTLAVAVVTVPSHLYDESALERCIHACDIAVKLQAFSGTELEKNAALSNYHGFFHLNKLAPINSLSSKHPEAVEYVFKLKRRKFVIEVFHLPPDINNDETNEDTSGLPCASSSKPNMLDF